jgi:hypothetical protein
MKPIRLTKHAVEQCLERGASPDEVREAIASGVREPARHDRLLCRLNFQYNDLWNGRFYAVKQVAAVITETHDEIVVITVYTFFY